MKTKTLYQLREHTKSDEYSVPLSLKLRKKERAKKLLNLLKKRGRIVFMIPYKISI